MNVTDSAQSADLTASSAADFMRMARLLKPARKHATIVLACILLSATLGVIFPLLLRELIDEAIPKKDLATLNWLVIAMIVVSVLIGLIGVLQEYLVALIGQNIVKDLRRQMYQRLSVQSIRFFIKVSPGEIASRVQSDTDAIESAMTNALVTTITNLIIIAFTLVVLLSIDVQLALVALGVLPLFILPANRTGHARGKLAKQRQERVASLNAHLHRTLSVRGFMLMRLFGAQDLERKRFATESEELSGVAIEASMAGRWLFMWVSMFVGIGPALIYWFGGLKVINGSLSLGTVVAFVLYLGKLYTPVNGLLNAHVDIRSASYTFRRIFEYMDLRVEIVEPATPQRAHSPRGALKFDNVSMHYTKSDAALSGVSFEAAPGQLVALVGPSGAGKTTIANLATRLYDPSNGRITLDGINLRDMALCDIANTVSTVTQEAGTFTGSIADNLRYAKADATPSELERACQLANIHEFIVSLPMGYHAVVGEGGYNLSGGERQRLAIARAILADPRLLILDEATSALDSQSERLVRDALEPLLKGRTSLVIAHRLSTIVRADIILVLNQGRIVERGTHDELVQNNGLYRRLYDQQFLPESPPGGK